MGDCEPMDVDSEFDDKENVLTCRQKLQSIENVIDNLDASEVNMKLRMSCTPMSSPLTSSTTCNSQKFSLEAGDNSLNKGINLTNTVLRSSGDFSDSNLSNSQSSVLDNLGNTTAVQDITLTTANNNVSITLNHADTLEKENSIKTSTSTSPIPIVHDPDEKATSPILRGLKSVLNMFRPSQSPVSSEVLNADISESDRTLSASPHMSDKVVLSSTPVSDSKPRDFCSSSSPQRQGVRFNEDLVEELQWNDETIIFGNDKVPLRKLFPITQPPQSDIDDECEAMDISMNNTFDLKHCVDKQNDSEAQIEFHDCANISVIKESAIAIELDIGAKNGNENTYKVSSSCDSKKCEEALPDDCVDDQFESLDNSLSIIDLQTHKIVNDVTFNTNEPNKNDGPCKQDLDLATTLNKIAPLNDINEIAKNCNNVGSLDSILCEKICSKPVNCYDESEFSVHKDAQILKTNNRANKNTNDGDNTNTNEKFIHLANNELTNIKTESLENETTLHCQLNSANINQESVGTLTEIDLTQNLIKTLPKNQNENLDKQPEQAEIIKEDTQSSQLMLANNLQLEQSLLEQTDLINENNLNPNESALKYKDHDTEDKTLINSVVNNKNPLSNLIEPLSFDQLSLTILDQSKPENDLQDINIAVDELIERLDRDLFTSTNEKKDASNKEILISGTDSPFDKPLNHCRIELENETVPSNSDNALSLGQPVKEISDTTSKNQEFKATTVSELGSKIAAIPDDTVEELLPSNTSSRLISSSQGMVSISGTAEGHNTETNLTTVPEHCLQTLACGETAEHIIEPIDSTVPDDCVLNQDQPKSVITPCEQSVYISADNVFDSQKECNLEVDQTLSSNDENPFQTKCKLSHSPCNLKAADINTVDLNKNIESDQCLQKSSTNNELKIDKDPDIEQYIEKQNDSTYFDDASDTSDPKICPDETVIEVNTEEENTAAVLSDKNEDLLPKDGVTMEDVENSSLENNFLSLCNEKTSEWTIDSRNNKINTEGSDTDKTDTLQDICEFKSGELFINAEDFDFFMNKTTHNEITDCGKESLFLKFDPLCAQPVPTDVVVTTNQYEVDIETKTNEAESDKTLIDQSVQPHQNEQNSDFNLDEALTFTKTYIDKPVMAVTPALSHSYASTSRNTVQNSFCNTPKVSKSNQSSMETPRNMQHLRNITLNAKTPILPTRNSHTLGPISQTPRTSRQSAICMSPAIAAIEQLISLSGNNTPVNSRATNTDGIETLNQLKNLLVEKEQEIISLKEENHTLYSRLSDMETSIKTIEKDNLERIKNIEDLTSKLSQKTKENQEMAIVVEEYERTIATLIREKDENRIINETAKAQLIQERDEQTAHLASMEVSFNDLHSKYEKSKQVILSYKANENVLRSNLTKHEQTIKKILENYEALKEHATSKLNESNTEWEKFKKTHEAEVLKLSALIKRKDLHISSLEETLTQKTKANEELTAICDELLSKVA